MFGTRHGKWDAIRIQTRCACARSRHDFRCSRLRQYNMCVFVDTDRDCLDAKAGLDCLSCTLFSSGEHITGAQRRGKGFKM